MRDISDRISDLVKNAMKDNLAENSSNWPFLDPDDYHSKTGKRFRMTKDQKESGMSRDQAFQQFMEQMITK
jgi:hypothetical protein